MTYRVIHGDCLAVLRRLPDACIDACVTDPPAGISFMGKAWDDDKGGRDQWIAWLRDVMAEVLRVLKPGGHALVWALPRTSHWTGTALEGAGFEIRDRVHHLFGSGFPKSVNLGDGYGTALKPAAEDWWLVRKPLAEKTLLAQVSATGTGALDIDGCRVGYASAEDREEQAGKCASVVGLNSDRNADTYGSWQGARTDSHSPAGRWPAHLVLSHSEGCAPGACADGCPIRTLDEQSLAGGIHSAGKATAGAHLVSNPSSGYDGGLGAEKNMRRMGDSGGASRFFNTFNYVPKAPKKEKNAGCDHLPTRTGGEVTDREEGSAGLDNPRAGAGRTGGSRNFHPTVKSITLMQWLVRLITPPGADGAPSIVLDPFCGSGSTGVAVLHEGHEFLGIEAEADYLPIIEARLAHAARKVAVQSGSKRPSIPPPAGTRAA